MKKIIFVQLLVIAMIAVGCKKEEVQQLATPTGFTAKQSGNKVLLKWNPVDGATSYELSKNNYGWQTTSFTSLQDSDPEEGYNYYEIVAVRGESRSASTSVSINFSSGNTGGSNTGGGNTGGGNTGGGNTGGGNTGGGSQDEVVELSDMTISNVTSESATVNFALYYSSAYLLSVGVAYAPSANTDDVQLVSLDDTNMATLQSKSNGYFTITMHLSGLSSGTQYIVLPYAITNSNQYYGDTDVFTTTGSSSGGGNDQGGNLSVTKANLTGIWKYQDSYKNVFYWVLQSNGTVYYVQDQSLYLSSGTFDEYIGTWTVSGSSFSVTYKSYKEYYAGSLSDSGSYNDNETVSVRSLTSSSFVDGDGNTWTKTTLPSYVKL